MLCAITEVEHIEKYNCKIPIHHITYDKMCINEDKLISLCHECNGRVNSNRTKWTNYFIKLVEENK